MKNAIQVKMTLIVSLALALTGCNQSSVVKPTLMSPTEISRSVLTIDTSPVAKSELVPRYTAQLTFDLYGRVQSTYVEIGDEVQKGDVLVQLETTVLEADVARAENAFLAAQAELALIEKQKAEEATLNIAAAKIGMVEADLVRARHMLMQATLTAPFDGTIVDIQAVPGEMVQPGKVIVTLADMLIMQVETLDLTEMDISRIHINQAVEVYVEALDIVVDGYVSTIVPQATLLGEERVYKIIISLKSQPQNLLWGMSAEAKFIGVE